VNIVSAAARGTIKKAPNRTAAPNKTKLRL
jgi:hypothetical protein